MQQESREAQQMEGRTGEPNTMGHEVAEHNGALCWVTRSIQGSGIPRRISRPPGSQLGFTTAGGHTASAAVAGAQE